MSDSKKFLTRGSALAVCCLALTGVLAFAQDANTRATVTYPSAHAVSRALRELPIDVGLGAEMEAPRPLPVPMMTRGGFGAASADPVLQKEVRPFVSATKGANFDGVGANGFAPSDVNLAVGPNHIVQTVNVQLAVISKSGTLLSGPTNLITFFAPLGGDCAARASDPIVNYDRLADRWVISDVGIGTTSSSFSECIGVSKTNDPAGAYSLYAFSFGTTLNDYPKVGVWPTASNSAYLASYNLFANGIFNGAKLCGFDRTKMLAGTANPAQLCVKTPNTEGGYLPSDLDGPTPPTDGTPGLFLTWQNNNPGQLFLRKLSLNFAANFGQGAVSLSLPTAISVANTSIACVGTAGACVPQSGTTQLLDTLGDRLMHRFPVRHFADHDRAVANHAVANGSQVAFRWYELLDPAGTVTVNQQGTFAPDTTFRWMGSMAEDKLGDIAVGYSASSTAIHPAIRFTGRVPSDPLGTLETEASILEGTGSQTAGLSRWGDYTALLVDPSDDCTFWYTNQYEKVNGTFNGSTHIGSFAFAGCAAAGTPTVTLSVAKLNFLKTVIGVTSKRSFTLTNTGTATLNISSITASGDFAISSKTCGATVATGARCAVSVTFTPTAKGTRNGSLTFTDDASPGPQVVSLVGTGTAVKLTPTSLKFGTVTVGTTSPQQTITVTNVSAATVTFTSIGIVGLNPGDFPITADTCGATLAGGANCAVGISFKPLGTGTRKASLKLADDGGGSPQLLNINGTGTIVSVFPSSLSFGTVTVGTSSAARSVTVRNTGSVSLSFTGFSILGTGAGNFLIFSNTCASTLAAGASCVVKIEFKPITTGAHSATLNISDDGGGSPQLLNINGTGTIVSVSPSSLSFGTVTVGTSSAAQSVTVSNTGSVSLSFTGFSILGTGAGNFLIFSNTCASTLAAGTSCVVKIEFKPITTGAHSATLNISDDGGGSPQKVSLAGSGG